MLRFLLFFLLFSAVYSMDEELPRSSPEQIAASRRDFLIADRISPFSGQVILHERDMLVRGAEPLFVVRYFNPFCLYSGVPKEALPHSNNLKGSSDWRVFPHLFLFSSNRITFQVPDTSGMTYYFKQIGREAPQIWQDLYGICNACGEEVGGKYDVRNTKINLVNSFTIRIQRPDGTEQTYKARRGKRFALDNEVLPNGKVIRYYYSPLDELKVIESKDPSAMFTYARIQVGNDQNSFTSSSKIDLKYHFTQKLEPKVFTAKKGFVRPILASVESVFYPSESYLYNEELLLKEIKGKENTLNCGYALIGRKDIPVGQHHYRVSAIQFEGDDQEACFIKYKLPEAGKVSGETIVTQKNGLKIIYGISQQLLPSYIQWWDKNDLKKEKKFNWSANQWLDSIVVTDGRQNLYEKRFQYDKFGNPTEELFIDYITNENYRTKKVFSQDGRHLLLREETEEGKIVTFSYVPHTNLVTAKRTYDHEILLLEELNEYDPSYNLVKNTLKGMGGQHRITRYELRQQDPFLHMPEWIEELFIDNGKEYSLTKVHLQYDQWGNVEKENWYDSNGLFSHVIERTYNARGDLLRETDPLGLQAAYRYDERGRCIESISFSNRITTKKGYDPKGRLIKVQKLGDDGLEETLHYRYDVNDHLIEKQDHLGHSTFYNYDPVTKKVTFSHFPSSDIQTFSTYDPLGREIEKVDGNGHKTTMTYNSRDLPLTICHPDQKIEHFAYTKNGKLKTAIDEEGKITSYTYDVLGRVTSKKCGSLEERWIYDAFNLITYIDPEGNAITYSYDGAGRKVKEVEGPKTTAYSYDTLGRLGQIYFNDCLIRSFRRDLKGQILEEMDCLTDRSILSRREYTYDRDGNCRSTTIYMAGQPATETFIFDSFGRLKEKRDPLGYLTTFDFDEKFINEKGHRVLKKTTLDARSVQTVEIFDPAQRLVKKEIFSSGEIPFSQSYGYDASDNLLFQKNDLSEIKHTFSYSSRNWLEKFVRASGTADERATSYIYTSTGKRAAKKGPDGMVISYSYNDHGFLEEISSSDGTIKHHFVYDKLSHLVLAEDLVSNLFVQRQVDRFGNILSETFPDGRTVLMTYDPFDQLTLFNFGEGKVHYKYEGCRLKQVSRYDKKGAHLYTHSYDLYDQNGYLLEESSILNGGKTAHQYDLCGRKLASSSPFFAESLKYDPCGNVTEKKTQDRTSHYRYDPLSQMIQEDENLYVYDHQQNRSGKNSEIALCNSLDEITSQGRLSCYYDLRGNPVLKGDFELTYDALDHLVQADREKGSVRYVYDPLGRAYSRTFFLNGEKLSEEYYLYQGQEEIGTYSNEKLQQFKVLGLHDLPVAIELENQLFTPILDNQRNIVALVDPDTQNATYTYSYNAFGEVENAYHFNPWLFSSKRYDPFLKLINYGQRFYDPTFGRWLTTDPAGLLDGYNLYLYLHNNPLRYFDPDGRFAFALPLVTFIFGAAEISAVVLTVAEICEAAILASALFYGTKYIAQKTEAEPHESTTVQAPPVDEIGYVPIDPETGEKLPLPKGKHGVPQPTVDVPHTQIGWREGGHGEYKQTREWGENGAEIKRTDWSNHGSPDIHPNPHDHFHIPNPSGGTGKIGKATPMVI